MTLAIASFLAGFFVGGTGTGLIAVAAGIYPTAIRSTGIGWAMGMGRVGQVFGPILTGVLVGLGLQGRRHFLCRRDPVLHRRAVFGLPLFLASGDGSGCGRPMRSRSRRLPNRRGSVCKSAYFTDTFA